jgi:hypothetical protein
VHHRNFRTKVSKLDGPQSMHFLGNFVHSPTIFQLPPVHLVNICVHFPQGTFGWRAGTNSSGPYLQGFQLVLVPEKDVLLSFLFSLSQSSPGRYNFPCAPCTLRMALKCIYLIILYMVMRIRGHWNELGRYDGTGANPTP